MSDEATVAELTRLAWTYRGPNDESKPGETAQWVIRIEELPGFLAVGETREEALDDLRPALKAFLAELVAQKIAFPTPDPTVWQIGPLGHSGRSPMMLAAQIEGAAPVTSSMLAAGEMQAT